MHSYPWSPPAPPSFAATTNMPSWLYPKPWTPDHCIVLFRCSRCPLLRLWNVKLWLSFQQTPLNIQIRMTKAKPKYGQAWFIHKSTRPNKCIHYRYSTNRENFNRAKTLPTVQSKRIRTESTVFKLYVLCWKKKKKKKKEKKRRKKGTKHTSLQLLWSRLQSRLHLFGLMLIIVRNYYVFHIIHFILFIYFYCQLFLRRFQSYDLIFTCQRKTNVSSFCSETAPRRR